MKWIAALKEAAVWFLIADFALLKDYNTVSFIFEGVLTFLTPTVAIIGRIEAVEGSIIVGCGALWQSNWSAVFWRSSAFTFKGLEFQEENFKTCQNRSANVKVNFIPRKFFCFNIIRHCVLLYVLITRAFCISCYAFISIRISAGWTGNKDLFLGRVRYFSPTLHPNWLWGPPGIIFRVCVFFFFFFFFFFLLE